MKNKKKIYRLAVIILTALSIIILFVGCGKKEASQSGGVISDIKISTAIDQHDRPIKPETVFPADTKKFYCSFKLSGFPPDSKIKAEWIWIPGTTMVNSENASAPAQPLSFKIQQQTGTIAGDGYTSVVLEMPSSPDASSDNITGTTWLAGNYKVVLYVDNQEKGSTIFEVQEAPGAPTN